MTVLYENVECPSLSPDGKRVAYKKRLIEGGRIVWQLQVLDLATLAETVIAERRSIDDQLEWLDDAHVLYSVPRDDQEAGGGTDVWVARADGTGTPQHFLSNAYSPAVGS
jgi:Tol biopolymer transport system component